jgi:hypothetical protein
LPKKPTSDIPTAKHSPLDEVAERLDPRGIRAFRELCKQGCDSDTLNFFLSELMGGEVQVPVPDDIKSNKENWVVHPTALDRWETASGGRNLDDLERISRKARELLNTIKELRRTPFIVDMNERNEITKPDLLALTAHLPEFLEAHFDALLNLKQLAQKYCGPRKYTDLTRLMIHLIKYVRERTGDYQDDLLSTLLIQLIPDDGLINKPDSPISKKGLATWRKRHGLTA